MVLRILASLALLISVLFMPFWISVLLGVAGIFYFPLFYEAVVLFLLSDLLFAVKETRFFGITFVATIGTILVLLIIELLKKKLKFYPEIRQ